MRQLLLQVSEPNRQVSLGLGVLVLGVALQSLASLRRVLAGQN